MKKAFLKPAEEGLIVRDPVTLLPLPAEGDEVEFNSHWRRRLAQGDVMIAEKAKAQSKPQLKKEK
ncbi:DUF2635 domain-containing protein [uncultured Kiloniella sp.]|uniref:DUF2635 domain-containing protein n=1 Tax=uncultured Kiloniella sp. TaxID=1133091 RepID=UPI00261ADC15|nr:DUF2635 domain-containing protein [uncultured Kiloniella sp.]